jgi:hypothetical protein
MRLIAFVWTYLVFGGQGDDSVRKAIELDNDIEDAASQIAAFLQAAPTIDCESQALHMGGFQSNKPSGKITSSASLASLLFSMNPTRVPQTRSSHSAAGSSFAQPIHTAFPSQVRSKSPEMFVF